MNYHSDQWIMGHVNDHYNEAREYFSEHKMIYLALAGSQNYGVDTEKSDVDTKLILTPSFQRIAMNQSPISTTHVRANNSHTDWKDIRLMFKTFRQQNLNFLECLFTPYYVLNPMYEKEWSTLLEHREEIARYNLPKAISSMRGIAHRKYDMMEKDLPSHKDDLIKYGYSPKELHHLLRVNEYIGRYIDGESYANCLISNQPDYLKAVKLGYHNLEQARVIANWSISCIDKMCDKYLETCSKEVDKDVDSLLDDVQYNIMKIAIKKEIGD